MARLGMLIGLLGGTGRTGRALLALGLERGFRFRCLARDPDRLVEFIERVEVVHGDSLDEAMVSQLTHRCDAVISVLGHVKDSPRDLLTRSTRNVLISRPRRFILLTGAAVDLHSDRKKFFDEVASSGVRLFAGRLVRDSQDAADLVYASTADSMIVRTPPLNESPPRGNWRVSMERLPSSRPISRHDVADFLLRMALEPEPGGRTPFVSY